MTASHLRPTTLLAAAALPCALLLTTSCSTPPPGETSKRVVIQPGQPGGYTIETYKTTATVAEIDAAKRKLTVVGEDGKKRTLKAGPEVVNFEQILVGDKVVVTAAEELVVFMAKSGLPIPDGTASVVALAPAGAKPGLLMAGTAQITAKVIGLDRKNRKALLQLPDGTTKTFPVRPDIDLSKHAIGDEIVLRCTESIAIDVVKP